MSNEIEGRPPWACQDDGILPHPQTIYYLCVSCRQEFWSAWLVKTGGHAPCPRCGSIRTLVMLILASEPPPPDW